MTGSPVHLLVADSSRAVPAAVRLNDSEFTGPTFTQDGKVLFVNIQTPGITLAITGPWERHLG